MSSKFRTVSREINKGIKDERLLLNGRLTYYKNLGENIGKEVEEINQKLIKLLKEKERQSLGVKARIEGILKEGKKQERKNDLQHDLLVTEMERKTEQYVNAPNMIVKLEKELCELDRKRNKMMILPLKNEIEKLEKELGSLMVPK